MAGRGERMHVYAGLTGSAWGDWANYTDSPLRAFENELGVQPPVGFWDPVGFTQASYGVHDNMRTYPDGRTFGEVELTSSTSVISHSEAFEVGLHRPLSLSYFA